MHLLLWCLVIHVPHNIWQILRRNVPNSYIFEDNNILPGSSWFHFLGSYYTHLVASDAEAHLISENPELTKASSQMDLATCLGALEAATEWSEALNLRVGEALCAEVFGYYPLHLLVLLIFSSGLLRFLVFSVVFFGTRWLRGFGSEGFVVVFNHDLEPLWHAIIWTGSFR